MERVTAMRGMTAILMIAALSLAACGRKEPRLMNITANRQGPDEFAILPNKPLQDPPDYNTLPPPRLGAPNLADPTPRADAVAVLGGRPGAGTAADKALMARATRYGLQPDIRRTLAAEDLEWRRRHKGRILERWFNVNRYYRAYEAQSLDQYRELQRFRRLGVYTPSAPPDPATLP